MTNVERIGTLYELFGRGDVKGMLAMIAEDVDWGYDGPAPGVDAYAWVKQGRGHAKVVDYFRGAGESMEFHAFVPRHVLGDGDCVLTLVEVDFTIRATGKRVRTREAMHFTFDANGKIVRYRPVFDTAERSAAYGAA